MQRHRLLAGTALAGALVGALWLGAPRQGNPPEPAASTSVPVPAEPAPASPESAEPQAAQSEPAPAQPAPPALPRLTTRDIASRPVHAVPEDQIPPPPRPFEVKQGPALPQSPPPSYRPSTETASLPAASPPSSAPRPPSSLQQLAGAAQASGATALLVAGQPLHLFGVRPPASTDRCIANSGLNIGAPNCLEKARDTLAARLAHNPSVSCRLPSPKSAAGAAICLDSEGVDLGGLLVAEGLALADPSQSYDYVGAETVARTQGRGLWHFR